MGHVVISGTTVISGTETSGKTCCAREPVQHVITNGAEISARCRTSSPFLFELDQIYHVCLFSTSHVPYYSHKFTYCFNDLGNPALGPPRAELHEDLEAATSAGSFHADDSGSQCQASWRSKSPIRCFSVAMLSSKM